MFILEVNFSFKDMFQTLLSHHLMPNVKFGSWNKAIWEALLSTQTDRLKKISLWTPEGTQWTVSPVLWE